MLRESLCFRSRFALLFSNLFSFFFSSRRRHTRYIGDWSSDVCSSDLICQLASGDAVAGYTLAQMTSYYLLVSIVDALTAVAEDDWQIAADIKDGNISQFLLKPIDFLGYRLCLFGAGRIIFSAVALLPVTVFVFLLRDYFVPPADLGTFGLFAGSVVMAALITFFISYSMALLAFWVLE